jgi:hypothetical protein
MLRRALIFLAPLFSWTVILAGNADAQSCRSLQLQLNMAQASRETSVYQRLYGRMAQSGCLSGQRAVRSQPFDRLFPRRSLPELRRPRERARATPRQARPRERARAEPKQARTPREKRKRGGMSVARATYRTLCVRSCDGFYFPISFSTTRDHFEADQGTCNQMCPAGQAQIYYYANSSEGPESMRSMTGMPYTELPTAFQYRKSLNPSCSCGEPTISTASSGSAARVPGKGSGAMVPRPRPSPGEDPETLANRDGRFVPHHLAPILAGRNATQSAIRVVYADEPNGVPVSPVPNDFETSFIWNAPRSSP